MIRTVQEQGDEKISRWTTEPLEQGRPKPEMFVFLTNVNLAAAEKKYLPILTGMGSAC